MRIISGRYKGQRLISGKGLAIRPTTDRVKEYIFNILQDFPSRRRIVDIFAGSGSLGLEALSRGAGHVCFVENAFSSIRILKQNITRLKVPSSQYTILQQDAFQFARYVKEKYGLCLMDPPFKFPFLQSLLDELFERDFLTKEGIMVVEHEVSNPIRIQSELYSVFIQKKIGRSYISFLEKKQNARP